MVWQAVHEVEVEFAQELWVVYHDHVEHTQRRVVERLECWRHGLTLNHVLAQEGKQLHDELLDLVLLLQLLGVSLEHVARPT